MEIKTDQTTSFVVRFTQKIYDDDKGEPQVQWRGRISHVQGGEYKSFTDFEDVIAFIQEKLAALTLQSTLDKTAEEQEGILSKSFEIWNRMRKEGPKMVLDAIKDPKKQVAHFQEQITQVGDELSQKIELDTWRNATKADVKNVLDRIDRLTGAVNSLQNKLNQFENKLG